jgi:hypothetical protein
MLRDLAYNDDANGDKDKRGFVNITKREVMFHIIQTFQRFHQSKYNFYPVHQIAVLLDISVLPYLSEDEGYRLSLALEQKGASKSQIL